MGTDVGSTVGASDVGATDRHAELGHFLRTRRERLRPDAVGLSPRPRQRARGLRRDDVATRANVSQAWYTRLEQGCKVRPSFDVLENISYALQLDRAERRYLHALGLDPSGPLVSPEAPDVGTVGLVRQIVDTNRGMPYPVFAVDGWGDLLACNPSTSDWYADFRGRTGRERNIVRWTLTAPEARERLDDWHEHAREMVAALRYTRATRPADPAGDLVVRDLLADSAQFATWWRAHDVADDEVRIRSFRHPRLGRRTLQLVTIRPAVSDSLSIVYHLPG